MALPPSGYETGASLGIDDDSSSDPEDLLVVGAGGMGREVWSMVQNINDARPRPRWRLRGFLAADEPDFALLSRLDAPYLGAPDDPTVLSAWSGARFVVAIGNGAARRRIHVSLASHGLIAATVIDPSVAIGLDVEIGDGAVVCGNSAITTNVRIGQGAQINLMCSVSHDVTIGDFATFAPGVTLTGAVSVGDGAFLGTRCTVLPGVQIGADATVGAGAVVVRDVKPGTTVVGVPARPLASSLGRQTHQQAAAGS